MADPGALTASSIVIGQTVFAYSYFLPRLSDVRQGPADGSLRDDVILGQVAAGGVSLLVGALLAWMTSSMIPVIVTALIAAFIAGIYQYALNQTVVD